jgi:hypothetical protein
MCSNSKPVDYGIDQNVSAACEMENRFNTVNRTQFDESNILFAV